MVRMTKNLESEADPWPELFWIGGVLWVDFANSLSLERLNLGSVLESRDSVQSWFGCYFAEVNLEELADLRALMAGAVSNFRIGSPELASAIERVNDVLRSSAGYDQIRQTGDHFEVARVYESPLAVVAGSFANFLEGGDFGRVRKCAEPTCTLHFFDESKAGRRKWCSMSQCGNRAKATNHYRKTRSVGSN
jgi:hypothetical protein